MGKFKSRKSRKGLWYSKGWMGSQAIDTYNTQNINLDMIDTAEMEVKTTTFQMSEHILPQVNDWNK